MDARLDPKRMTERGSGPFPDMMTHPYANLAVQTLISGSIMYLAMFAMIDNTGSFFNNLNYLYMTLMMVAPMVGVMILAMVRMFPSTRINMILLAGAVAIFFGSFAAIRAQAAIGNAAFLRSMIPHHSGAILMCQQATLTDPEIRALCVGIEASQKAEIARMKKILGRY